MDAMPPSPRQMPDRSRWRSLGGKAVHRVQPVGPRALSAQQRQAEHEFVGIIPVVFPYEKKDGGQCSYLHI
jgi:hypothetical protein